MPPRRIASALAMLAVLAQPAAALEPRRPVIVYHESWLERPATGPIATTLAFIPDYATTVVLAFARPDLVYPGQLDISMTGLEYQFGGPLLRDAIALLKKDNVDRRVLLGIGGDAYKENWSGYDPAAVARLVQDLGADGIDLDYEPPNPDCNTGADGRVVCASDPVWRDLVRRTRAALPRPAILHIPVWSVGAFGEGEFADARPYSPYRGVMLDLLRAPEAAQIDALSIMSYDAGPELDPVQAFLAYRKYWRGPLAIGVNVNPIIAGGDWTPEKVQNVLGLVAADPAAGGMLYAILQRGHDGRPNGRHQLQNLCRALALGGCDEIMP